MMVIEIYHTMYMEVCHGLFREQDAILEEFWRWLGRKAWKVTTHTMVMHVMWCPWKRSTERVTG